MMRAAEALVSAYPRLNRDLLLAGILFHDSGKLWENCYAKESFVMPYDVRGELVGHIPIGIELVNRLWNKLKETDQARKASNAAGGAGHRHVRSVRTRRIDEVTASRSQSRVAFDSSERRSGAGGLLSTPIQMPQQQVPYSRQQSASSGGRVRTESSCLDSAFSIDEAAHYFRLDSNFPYAYFSIELIASY